jgi:hypothetical protein
VDERTEAMGAGYVLGADPEPVISFFARVGGPLASARAEAAGLLQLLQDVLQRFGSQVHLLIFIDCLVILDILRKCERSDFHPSPKEIVHFAVIHLLLHELRQWSGNSTLVKVKSYTGCLLSERADDSKPAELGRDLRSVQAPKNMGSYGCESDRQPESSLRTVTNPYRETALPIAVLSRRWWLSIPCEQSRSAKLFLSQIFCTAKNVPQSPKSFGVAKLRNTW